MIKLLVGPFVDLAKDWLQRRADKTQAKHERELRRINGEIDLDNTSASDMKHSLKDEWLTLVFTTPLVVVFYGSIVNDAEIINRMIEGITVISGLPEWYTYTIMGIVAASFGLRTFDSFKR